VALAPDPSWEVAVEPAEIREGFIEIRPVRHGDVVTLIEILSPTNKTPGDGRRLYRVKQKEVLSGPTHLLEIDLLRRGEHTVAAPHAQLLHRGPWDYLVSLSRGNRRDVCQVWGFTMRQRLPRIRVPLAGSDPDLVLDLQPLFTRVYDEGAFDRQVDYALEPAVRLARDDAEWADALLRQCGLRR
jgi:hypothetical protein